MGVDIMGIIEMLWFATGRCEVNDHAVHYSGNAENANGVGMILSKNIQQHVSNITLMT